jgi:ATP-dependent DNA ligase
MVKVKYIRTADFVLGGFRYASKGRQVGSLLLGLYDSDNLLNHVGFCSSFTASERAKPATLLKPGLHRPHPRWPQSVVHRAQLKMGATQSSSSK